MPQEVQRMGEEEARLVVLRVGVAGLEVLVLTRRVVVGELVVEARELQDSHRYV